MKLYEKLTLLRKQRGMSQEDLAKELDVSRQSVYKWETGLSYPEMDKLKKIAEIFGVSFDALLNDNITLKFGASAAEEASATTAAPAAPATPANATKSKLKFRPVFVSKRQLSANHSDVDHGYSTETTKAVTNSAEIFKQQISVLSAILKQRGYTYYVSPQQDLAAVFFYDEKRDAIGWLFDGCERFVCPVENIITVSVSDSGSSINYSARMHGVGIGVGAINSIGVSSTPIAGMSRPVSYTMRITYFTANGGTGEYVTSFNVKRMRYAFEEGKQENNDPMWITILENSASQATANKLEKIQSKILSLKARGELIKNGDIEVPQINIEEYASRIKASDSQRDAFEATVTGTAKAHKRSKKIAGIVVGVAVAVFVIVSIILGVCGVFD